MKKIRNFSIVAHIDHGKSTLSDKFIQNYGVFKMRKNESCILDTMELEKERGITIKAQCVTLNYELHNENYQLNLIDTPGHSDFSYEVSRSLTACEGILLLIDASKGIEAQTLTNFYYAKKLRLKIIPVINKIDLPFINLNAIKKEIQKITQINISNIVCCSAKTGQGITEIVENIIRYIPSPSGDSKNPLQALVIDSWFDDHLGVMSIIRVKNGSISLGEKITFMSTGNTYTVSKLGIFTPKKINVTVLNCGEIGWLACSIKCIYGAPIGDTITSFRNPALLPLSKLKKITPKLYSNLYPTNTRHYSLLNRALNKLSLNDSALFYEKISSLSLGNGFRCGFLGTLHMEIVQSRLEREYNLDIITTLPTVIYEIKTIDKKILHLDSPTKLPNKKILEFREPIARCHIFFPQIYIGKIIALCIEKRGVQIDIIYYDQQILLIFEIPMSEIIISFINQLQSISNGYASLDYYFQYFKNSDIVVVDILINKEKINEFSIFLHRSVSNNYGKNMVLKLQRVIPRQQFPIIIQASINNRVVFRSTIKPFRKNVLAKCYGGDVSRKKKLLQKQKKGKIRINKMKNFKFSKEIFSKILNFKSRQ